ncbi:hypothetical protein RJ55_01029 [Drechmeria coniospora]|nr:hypothetical protein RJ55_01029 [Drechmeria coniospora]
MASNDSGKRNGRGPVGFAPEVSAQTAAPIPQDLQKIWEWNRTVPASVERCVHDVIHERVQAQPEAPAICAWDGELTYGELDRLSTGLASRLMELGVGPNIMVPLCFEKSMWTTVAMLGVSKAGATFVLLDSSLPECRLRSMTRQVKAEVMVSALPKEALGQRLVSRVVTLGSHVLEALYEQPIGVLPVSDPSSTMYVAFTSGSTGTPKGALISHQNLASALYHQEVGLRRTKSSRVYDFSSYGFDVSICNVFTTLAAGGCFCVPNEHDRRNNLAQSIASCDANAIDLTPSVARLLSPELVPGLETIIFGGEALHVKDVNPWWGKLQIVNLYGPCECTPNSSINYNPTSAEDSTHMGKGLGLVTWIVDADDHDTLLPLGNVGELLLEGPLVGLGYLDEPGLTAAAFIRDPAWLLQGAPGCPGRQGRLYKTGDLVRYGDDGNLVFVGRKDSQVKIRGQRVELGEIEHVLRSHDSVDDAAVVLQHHDGQDAFLAGYVTVCDDDSDEAGKYQPSQGQELQLVREWEMHFDAETYSKMARVRPETIGRDFIGWTSMYDGRDIDVGEMEEWLVDTMQAMLNGKPARHVLEIGTGSGMVLFNLGQGLESYVGLEPTEGAVGFLAETVKKIPELAPKVKIYRASAGELRRLEPPISANLVVLNSVLQYFPSEGYLSRVIEDVLELDDVDTIFVGDVRSYALHRQFLSKRTLHLADPEAATKGGIRTIMAEMERAESELLVDPAFFTALPARFPGRIQHVEILPKLMAATNELSSYRYAAVLHVSSRSAIQPLEMEDVGPSEWVNFVEQQLDGMSLAALLERSSSLHAVAVCNIPNSKTVLENQLVDFLDESGSNGYGDTVHWLKTIRQRAEAHAALSAADLVALASRTGYKVEVSWARQFSQRGGLDAIFHRRESDDGRSRFLFRFPTDNEREGQQCRALTSQPMRQQRRHEMLDQLQKMLRNTLPSYMLPHEIIILDEMPLSVNGKADRRALEEAMPCCKAGLGSVLVPGPEPGPEPEPELVSMAERQMREIWGRVLGINPWTIRSTDAFFRLGGNSIAAMKVVGEARTAGLELTVGHIFSHPELQDLVRQAGASLS